MLMGDLNTTMWSPYFHELETQAGLRNARDGFGILPTWPQKGQWPMFRIPLDHCLVSPEIRVEAFRVGSNIGSDHLPIIVDVTIPE
jgi:endonuclease/exonuclease/phosphatase (EEP) superfamily protein YafD